MLEELQNASEQLCMALERYVHICSSIQDLCLQGIKPRSVHPDYVQKVDREYELAELYDTKIQQAKLAIKTTRNHTFSIAPANCLPPEILTRILHMARDAEPCHVGQLALVCSRWRSAALNSPSLWSHIDCLPHMTKWFYPEILAQAKLHISRSGKIPLELHLSARSEAYNANFFDQPVEGLCQLVAPRMKSLTLDLEEFYRNWVHDGPHSVFSTLLSRCTPGVFTKLVLKDPDFFGFITTTGDGRLGDSTLKVDLTHTKLDEIFSSITVLHLTGLFLRWTSHAYHGLVDLRLCAGSTGRDEDNTIHETQLVHILKASPGLRVLHFELRIIAQSTTRNSVLRVPLIDLEILQVESGCDAPFSRIEDFLRLLEPGSKPLHLSIRHSSYRELFPTETRDFFRRANVTKIYVNGLPHLFDLFPSLPHLKVLIVSRQRHSLGTNPPPSNPPDVDLPPTLPRLDVCFILDCSLPLDKLLVMSQRCQPRRLILFDNNFYRNRPDEKVEMEIVRKELISFCPDVITNSVYPCLTEHRDLLYDHY